MRSRRLGGSVLALVSAIALLPVLTPGPSASAAARAAGSQDKATTAAARAHRAAAHLARVEAELDEAVRSYDDALGGLDQQVADGVAADDQAQAAATASQAAQDQRTERVRAIYMQGGQLGIYASVLSAGTPQDLALRVVTVQHIVAASDDTVVAAAAAQVQAQQQAALVGAQTQHAVLFADDVTARAARVTTLVREGRSAYARLSARARSTARAALAHAQASADQAARGAAGRATAMPIPANYLALYQGAARTCSGMSWTLLAAVGQVESGHGRNNGPSSAGAIGPMQFRPRTFAAYAVDGDHDGRTSAWDPADAIFTAAHFLCVGGAGRPAGVQGALLRYNAAQWYVDLVLSVQQKITLAY